MKKSLIFLFLFVLALGFVSSQQVTADFMASRTGGVAPLSVFFDAKATSALSTDEPFHDLYYSWNFGDLGSGIWAVSGKSKNSATGPLSAHVFDSPGTYIVTLTVKDKNGYSDTHTETITVTDPDVVFSGTNTICISSTGSFIGCPTGAQQVTSSEFSDYGNYVAQGKRILFKRGDTFDDTGYGVINALGPGIIGAYGSGAKPLVTIYDGGAFKLSDRNPLIDDWRIMDLEFRPADSTVADNSRIVDVEHSVLNTLIYGLEAMDFGDGIMMASSTINYWNSQGYPGPMHTGNFLVENKMTDAAKGYLFGIAGHKMAVLGNVLEDAEDAEHVLRVFYTKDAVISHNDLYRPATTKHQLKLHGGTGPDATVGFVITDNIFRGSINPWTVSIGTASSSRHEDVWQGIVERNYFTSGTGSQIALQIAGYNITARNNIFDISGAKGYYGASFSQRGVALPPENSKAYNNLCYHDQSNSGARCVYLGGSVIDSRVYNNLMITPDGSGDALLGTGNNLQSGNNLAIDTSEIINPNPSSPSDLKPLGTSSAIDVGSLVPVFEDFEMNVRDLNSIDIGAFEYTGPVTPKCSDGLDNDGDGLIDWEYDLGCYNDLDMTEGRKNNELDNGWTVFEPSADTRIIYVSSSTGSDANDGSTPALAVSSLSRAHDLVRDGFPDWILLKRGDTWTAGWGIWKSGRSGSERLVIASYGSSKIKPRLHQTGSRVRLNSNGNHSALIGIHFEGPGRNNSTDAAIEINSQVGKKYNHLYEDLELEEFSSGILFRSGLNNLVIRRNKIYNTEMGMIGTNYIDMTVEENLFFQNGNPGHKQEHNFYEGVGGENLIIRKNIFSRGGGTGLKLRAPTLNGSVYDNLFLQNMNGIYFSLDDQSPRDWVQEDMNIYNNVFLDQGYGGSQQLNFVASTAKNLNVANNIIAHSNRSTYGVGLRVITDIANNSYGTGPPVHGLENINIEGNILYNLSGSGLSSRPQTYDILNTKNNIVQNVERAAISYRGNHSQINHKFSNNTYHSRDTVNRWFDISNTYYDFSSWTSYTGDTGSSANSISFPNPERSVTNYYSSLGGDGTVDGFIGEFLSMDKFSWNKDYTAEYVNEYIRAGFGRSLIVCGDSTCDIGETCGTCEADCGKCSAPGPTCGDGNCDVAESCSSCEADCGKCTASSFCGDGNCDIAESCSSCEADCGTCTTTNKKSGGGSSGGSSSSTLTTPTTPTTNPLTGRQKFFLKNKIYKFETKNRFIKRIDLKIAKDADVGSIELSEKASPSKPITKGRALQAFEIAPTFGLSDESVIDSGIITFSVPESWINDNFVDREEGVKLGRLTSEWIYYDSEFISQEDSELTYKASVPGFSEFVIVGLTKRELLVGEKNQKIISLAGLSIALIIVGSGIAIIIIFLQIDAVRRRKKKAMEGVRRSQELVRTYVGKIGE